jgi:large subunit ribosomal protein L30
MIQIQQYRSVIRTTQHQRRIMKSLGMRRIGHVRQLPDNPCVRGMIDKVAHLVRIVESASK